MGTCQDSGGVHARWRKRKTCGVEHRSSLDRILENIICVNRAGVGQTYSTDPYNHRSTKLPPCWLVAKPFGTGTTQAWLQQPLQSPHACQPLCTTRDILPLTNKHKVRLCSVARDLSM